MINFLILSVLLLASCKRNSSSQQEKAEIGSSTVIQDQSSKNSFVIPLQKNFALEEKEWNDPQYFGKLNRYTGFPLEKLLLASPEFVNLSARLEASPGLIDSYLILFHTLDNYLPAMELRDVLDCGNDKLPANFFNSPKCTQKLSSGFIAVAQLNRSTAKSPCQFDPVGDRLPEIICPGEYYLIWPRLINPKYEFKAPYQLVSLEIIQKEKYYDADIYPEVHRLGSTLTQDQARTIQRGANNYFRFCSSCHSVNLKPIERSRSFDFLVPNGLANIMTSEQIASFLYSKTLTPGIETFDPKILSPTMIDDIVTYLKYMSTLKKCDSLASCTDYCKKKAGENADALCQRKRFL